MSIDTVIAAVLDSPDASNWLKDALRTALQRDCNDAVADAEALLEILERHAAAKLSAAQALVQSGSAKVRGGQRANEPDPVLGMCK